MNKGVISVFSENTRAELVILNFVTDQEDPILGFAHEWINELAALYDSILVISGSIGVTNLPSNVNVKSTGWKKGKKVQNFLRALLTVNVGLLTSKPKIVFTHMNYWFSILAFPATLVLSCRQILWYSHAHKKRTLFLATALNDVILTPVRESFPIQTDKVYPIGHAINTHYFNYKENQFGVLENFVHVGRLDDVKRLSFILNTLREFRKITNTKTIKFDQIGSPSDDTNTLERDEFLNTIEKEESWTNFYESCGRSELGKRLEHYQVFLHASLGSIDKAPLEAALAGLIVLTDDPLTYRELGSSEVMGEYTGLAIQLEILHELSESERVKLQYVQRQNVLTNHSLSTLGQRFMSAVAQSQS